MRRLPANLGRTAVGVWNADNLVLFLVGGVAAGSASFLDDDVRNSAAANQLGWGSTFETGGGPSTAPSSWRGCSRPDAWRTAIASGR